MRPPGREVRNLIVLLAMVAATAVLVAMAFLVKLLSALLLRPRFGSRRALAGGFLLGKRRAGGVTLHVVWAWIMIALVGLAFMLALVAYGDATVAERARMSPTVILILVSSVVMAIYPTFLLIWMSRRFVRREMLA